MSGRRPNVKEKDAQRAILEWLTYKRVFHYRNNSGAFIDKQNHFYRFGALGSPDIVAVVKGRYVGIEVKGTFGRQSQHQKEFERQLTRAGGIYILAHGIEDVEKLL